MIAFVVAEVIPFFSDLLSLGSSLFDCWFGFVFWGVAYFRLVEFYNPDTTLTSYFKTASWLTKAEMIVNVFLVVMASTSWALVSMLPSKV